MRISSQVELSMSPEMDKKKNHEPRKYPPFWERAVPFLVGMIGLIIIALLVVAVLVAVGIFPA
jgi:hypothetical protein